MTDDDAAGLPAHASTVAALFGELADRARALAQRHFRSGLAVETKPDRSPVTEADRAIEAALRALIAERFPEHGIWGEEQGHDGLRQRWLWVLDPIDGTKAFVTGLPLFVTLIALLDRGRPVFGAIEASALGERWQGGLGVPPTWNGVACRTRPVADLAEARMYSTTWVGARPAYQAAIRRLAAAVGMPRAGGDGYVYGLLASGFVDLVLDCAMQPYDYMAMVPVIEGAGGRVTDWQGRTLTLAGDGNVLAAANPRLHEAALRVLAG
jgi:inositol-phosphate phosphatase/L-galactose 1-phosphate phosphatase/histidinol-phosphatase